MNLFIEKFIKLSVLTSAVSILILLLGLLGLIQMPLRFLPKMDQALIAVSTIYPGADSQVVKSFVTTKIQNAIVGVDGMDYMTSTSKTGMSEVMIHFLSGTDMDAALTTTREKINGIQNELPSEIKPSTISKMNSDNRPIFILGFSSQSIPRADVAEYLRRAIEPQIEAIDGVAEASVWGDQYAMQVWLNPNSLIGYHLSPADVVNALRSQNVVAASGNTKGNYFNYTLNTTTSLHTADEFNNLVIKVVNNVPIRLKDIGEARMGAKDDTTVVYYNDKSSTMIGVQTLPKSNPLTVIDAILQKLPQITKEMPVDLTMHVVLNRVDFIRSSLHEVITTLLESIVIVIAVIFLFLGNLRAALIPAVTIPLSIIGICFLMNLVGYSINSITLLAMVLAVGLVVDDAIVVVENCVRHLNAKLTPMQSTIIASQELIVPIIAMTITLAAVFVPIGFTSGLIGQLFTEFAFTLAGSVLISGFIALTLSPMMAARLINLTEQHRKFSEISERIIHWLQGWYQSLLLLAFRQRKWMIIAWLVVMFSSVLLYMLTPSELMPTENQGFLLVIGNAPQNANSSYLQHYAINANQIYKKFNAIGNYATILSPEGYVSYLISNNQNNRQSSMLGITGAVQEALSIVPGLDFHVITPSILASSGPSIQFVLQGNDYKQLYNMAKKIEAKAMQSGTFMYLFDDLNYNKPQANLVVNSNAAAAANVSMSNIADSISVLMSNREVQQFSSNDQSYDVVIKTLPQYQLNPENLQNIPIMTARGTTVPLSTVTSLNYSVVPSALNQFQKTNSVILMGSVLPGHTISQGLSVLSQIANATIPKNMATDYAGGSRQFLQEGHRILIIFALALLIIFLVLSMQFESYRDSLIIILGSVPMALFAALLPLKFCGSINIYTQIGLLTLIGLISKHGILITRFANEIKVKERIDRKSAVIKASILRFRPILMTTVAILFGALPLIHATGAGSESRHAIGLVIGFGMSIGTLLTLLLLPIVYHVFSRDIDYEKVAYMETACEFNQKSDKLCRV